MKRIRILLTIIAICALTVLLTSCKEEKLQKVTLETDMDISTIEATLETKEGTKLLGLFAINNTIVSELPAGNYHALYQKGVVPSGEYYLVYVNESDNTYPDVKVKGNNFSGWFDGKTRITSISESDVIYARYIDFAEAGLVVLVCIGIVFAMLAVLAIVVYMFRFVAPRQKASVAQPQKVFSMDDIKDEDMLVAALIATIDYHNEIKKDVRVVSIKEIK